MGFLFSKKKKTIELKADEQAILKCKLCRDDIKKYIKKLENNANLKKEKAKEALKAKNKDRAKLNLRMEKMYREQIKAADGKLEIIMKKEIELNKEEKLKDINLNKFFEKTKSRDIFKSTDSKYKSVSFNNKFENLSNNINLKSNMNNMNQNNKPIQNNTNASTTTNNNPISFNMDYFNKNMESKKSNEGSTYNFKKNKADPFANLVSFKK